MVNIFLEIERLRAILASRGLDQATISKIASKAEQEIAAELKAALDNALDSAIEVGVQKDSADFINELRPRDDAFILDTESGNTDFSEPPFPMLDRLLATGAKPMKDGSGVYKIIPVGAPSKVAKRPIYNNIFDAQKAVAAERYAEARDRYNAIKPKNSKVNFRTATSKQSSSQQWVRPEQPKDFAEDLKAINDGLHESRNDIIMRIIRSYEEGF